MASPTWVAATKKALGWEWTEPFYVPDEALQRFRQAVLRGAEEQNNWQLKMEQYKREFPNEAAELDFFMSGGLPDGWDDALPTFTPDKGPMAISSAPRGLPCASEVLCLLGAP